MVHSRTYGTLGPNAKTMGELARWRRAGAATDYLAALPCSPSPLPPTSLVLKVVISFVIVRVLFIIAIAESRGACVS